MEDTFYINIHTHTHNTEKNIISVINAEPFSEPGNESISVGFHPWYLKKFDRENIFEELLMYAATENVIAIGECGLDKNSEAPKEMQERFFKEQIRIATRLNKPMIIHCVKAFDDLMRIKKECKASIPFIVHGFNNNVHIAKQLLSHGFYLSFGKALMRKDSNAQAVIGHTGFNSFFLETDDAEISIMSIFEKAAEIKGCSIEQLKKQMMLNFKTIFNYG